MAARYLIWLVLLAKGMFGYTPGPEESPTTPNVDMSSVTESDIESAFAYAVAYSQNVSDIESLMEQTGAIIPPGSLSAEARHQRFTRIHPLAIKMDQNERLFEAAARYLSNNLNLSRDQAEYGLNSLDLTQSSAAQSAVQDCQDLFSTAPCDENSKYRTADGSCNNLDNPLWGKSFTCFLRILPADYADGVGTPRVAGSGAPLPNARLISTTIHTDVDINATTYTLMTMQWGQFMDHDMTLTPMTTTANGSMIECCDLTSGQPKDPACLEIPIPSDDYFFSPLGQDCLNFVRSAACNDACAMGQRQQTDQLTSFIDASNIYGSLANDTAALRQMLGGLMRSQDSAVGELLPPSENPANDQCSLPAQNRICFQAGDTRVNEQPALTCMHTIWLRQHNRIAKYLSENVYSGQDDEFLFQETRRIIGAQLQAITYGLFLPVVLGPDLMDFYNLYPGNVGDPFTTYNSTLNPTIHTEFSTAAYRFGHSLLQNFFAEVDSNANLVGVLPLKDNFFFPYSLFNGSLDLIMRGLFLDPAQMFDRHIVQAVTNHLYKKQGAAFGMDLPALNIQRGRDHGVNPYTSYVKLCGGPDIQSFSDLELVMSTNNSLRLQAVYQGLTVHDIDLFTGGVCEFPNPGAVVGPTFGCIIGFQFHNLKFGDRFYFEHGGQAGSFTPAQLDSIRQTTLSRVICANSGVDQIEANVFLPLEDFVGCGTLPDLDLDIWN